MRTTGESPSPTETCDGQVPERYCVARRPGGKLRDGNCPAQNFMPMRLNSIRLLHWMSLRRNGEIGLLRKDLMTPTKRVNREIIGSGKGGWSERGRKAHQLTVENRAGAKESCAVVRVPIVAMEHGKAVSVKGGRKVKA
jgi:hypothetical protein